MTMRIESSIDAERMEEKLMAIEDRLGDDQKKFTMRFFKHQGNFYTAREIYYEIVNRTPLGMDFYENHLGLLEEYFASHNEL